MRSLIYAVVGVSAMLATASAEAGNPRRFHGNAPNQQNSVPSKQAIIGAYGRAVYPKYYYGFHSRDFQNIGMPHGDIGILGSGMTRNPW
jgi:hypothetical protein